MLGNEKAALWVNGRKKWVVQLQQWRAEHPGKVVWVHAASLGEFEQGRPVIEAIKAQYPDVKILLTFFSPSGFEIRKNYALADGVFYLPADTPHNAATFVKILKPDLTIFVKYEYWANYFIETKKAGSTLWVISGIFREKQRFFGIQKSFWSRILNQVDYFFLQNETSQALLKSVSTSDSMVCGDTRFDRVEAIAQEKLDLPIINSFLDGSRKVIVGGSTYEPEERILSALLEEIPDLKCIVAPHEISETRIKQIETQFGVLSARYSHGAAASGKRCLIIDNMGMLSQLYRYGTITLIGGGFGKGIHNILEAAVYGQPVFFGPTYQKFDEAVEILRVEGGFSGDSAQLSERMKELLGDEKSLLKMSNNSRSMVERNLGAVSAIMEKLENQGILMK